MIQPKKWRETSNPFDLNFKKFSIKKILGYPHSNNDLFYVLGHYNKKKIKAFIKVSRNKQSNFEREIKIINQIDFPFKPQIIDYLDDYTALITKEIKGKRLSNIVGNKAEKKSIKFMYKFGETLALIHKIKGIDLKQNERKFYNFPPDENIEKLNIQGLKDWLIKNKPTKENICFCHGDFHYANVLWKNKKIVAVLDYEFAGVGNKEFDIAWALIRRPQQKFMKTNLEMDEFLNGYKKYGNCNINFVKYYMVQIYCYFYIIGKNSDEYQSFIINWIKEAII